MRCGGVARLIAAGDVLEGEAITITYGALSNTSLLQDYGFIVDDNPHDKVDMLASPEVIQVHPHLISANPPVEDANSTPPCHQPIPTPSCCLNKNRRCSR